MMTARYLWTLSGQRALPRNARLMKKLRIQETGVARSPGNKKAGTNNGPCLQSDGLEKTYALSLRRMPTRASSALPKSTSVAPPSGTWMVRDVNGEPLCEEAGLYW